MIPSSALNPEDQRSASLNDRYAAFALIAELKGRNERLALSNRMLRDRIANLIELLKAFGVHESP